MHIIVIRHAQTEYNEKQLVNGWYDEDISKRGRAEIPKLIEKLSSYSFDVMYASTLKRAIETATPIAEHFSVPLKTDQRIIDVGFGSFEGKSWDATFEELGHNAAELLGTCAYDYSPYGGESAAETRERVESFLADLKKRPNEVPLIVTHGGIVRWLYVVCADKNVRFIANLSVHTFEI